MYTTKNLPNSPIYWEITDAEADMPMHFHSHVELIYSLEENVFVVDNNTYPLRAGDILVIFPMQNHCITGVGHKRMIINFTTDYCAEYQEILWNYRPVDPVIPTEKGCELEFLLQQGYKYYTKHCEDNDMFASRISKGNLISIVGICFSGMNLIKFNDQNISDLKKLISFCSENYTKHLSLDLIAQELNMSRTNVSKFFSEGLQKNFYDFINMFRIAHASRLLETSSGSITEIAMNAGFENIRTFNRAFKKVWGMTPTEFQEALLQG